MKISELLTIATIDAYVKEMNKEQVIDHLSSLLYKNGNVTDLDQYRKDIWERERIVSTAVGMGVAIPHAKSGAVAKTGLAFAKSIEKISYDEEKVNLVFMIAAGENASDDHLKALSKLSTYLMDEVFRSKLIIADTPEEVLAVINEKENEEYQESVVDSISSETKDGVYLVGITACTAGIAHTYMSAQSLVTAAEKRGIKMKVQTDGSSGTENRLTDEEIERADGVIIAADRGVDLSRFNGKKLVSSSTKQGINNPDKLIDEVLAKTTLYKTDKSSVNSENSDSDKEGKGLFDIYKHLMNGVSFMLPFVVAGGILIAISFMFGANSSNIESEQYNAFAAFLNTVGGQAAFGLMVPIFAGYVSFSIADRPGLAPGAIGGYIASIGGSGFLGGLIAGFIAGYTIELLKRILGKLPKSLQGMNPVLFYPVLGTLITTTIIQYVINTPVASINNVLNSWLAEMTGSNAMLVGAILAAILVSDMGGALNKIAYAFGIQMLTAGVYGPMAALMAGGMIPPLGIALATTIFKNRFNETEREAGKVAYVLGASFITEGVIPFAASDPIRIIPINIISAAVGGALSMALGIELTAPHGGIFVIPFAVNKPLLYVGCIVAGSLVYAGLIGILKKKPITDENGYEIGGIVNVSDN